jgi:DNA processing protein
MARHPDTYWLALRRVHSVGPRTCRVLLERFGSAERIFGASESELAEAGIPVSAIRNLLSFNQFAPLEKELCELERLNARLCRWSDPEYPENLRHIPDPPPYFYLRGDIQAASRHSIAIVGARTASDAGLRMAHRLGLELAAKGMTVISGLARGIDAEAHQGALDAQGRTIAVMASGIDVIYPPEHRKLADAILINNGVLLTELPVGTPPIAENFPARNRILSGLCLGVVVVEAAERSGSLITARMALEQDRQVFAVPGSPLSNKTRGSNRLLKDGAKLVECVEDVLEELAPQLARGTGLPSSSSAGGQSPAHALRATAFTPETDEIRAVIESLKSDHKLHIDSIIEQSGLGASVVLRILLELELKGIVSQHPGKLFALAAQ